MQQMDNPSIVSSVLEAIVSSPQPGARLLLPSWRHVMRGPASRGAFTSGFALVIEKLGPHFLNIFELSESQKIPQKSSWYIFSTFFAVTDRCPIGLSDLHAWWCRL